MEKQPTIGDYEHQRDGSYRLYTGTERGWILCDDHADLNYELQNLGKESADGESED